MQEYIRLLNSYRPASGFQIRPSAAIPSPILKVLSVHFQNGDFSQSTTFTTFAPSGITPHS